MSEKLACQNCVFWKKAYGTFTVTGWTGMDRDDGHCHFEPRTIPKRGDDFCHNHKREGAPDVKV